VLVRAAADAALARCCSRPVSQVLPPPAAGARTPATDRMVRIPPWPRRERSRSRHGPRVCCCSSPWPRPCSGSCRRSRCLPTASTPGATPTAWASRALSCTRAGTCFSRARRSAARCRASSGWSFPW